MHTFPSPAKINRFLHIVGKREDGFHQLQTLYQFISLQDTLGFSILETDEIRVTPALTNTPLDMNLIYKAAHMLKQKSGCTLGVHVHMDKKIPLGGGCGGGSSNAATTLLVLNALWGIHLSLSELMQLGSALGSDVCAFLFGQSAWGEGRGELLSPAFAPEETLILAIPACHCNTGRLFQHPDLTRDTPICTIGTHIPLGAHNDFEPLVRALYPEVNQAFEWLDAVAKPRLNGSGSSVFASFASRADAEKALEKKPKTLYATVVDALEVSPLVAAMKDAALYLPSDWGVAKR